MRDDPGLNTRAISVCLEQCYGVIATAIAFRPIGYDPIAAAYRADAAMMMNYFKPGGDLDRAESTPRRQWLAGI